MPPHKDPDAPVLTTAPAAEARPSAPASDFHCRFGCHYRKTGDAGPQRVPPAGEVDSDPFERGPHHPINLVNLLLQTSCYRRIEDEVSLKREIAALEIERNQAVATIDWSFSITDAQHKLRRIYPSVSP